MAMIWENRIAPPVVHDCMFPQRAQTIRLKLCVLKTNKLSVFTENNASRKPRLMETSSGLIFFKGIIVPTLAQFAGTIVDHGLT